jgi:hypothetical protein
MIFSYWEWETQTMFFENSEEVQKFLHSFDETLLFFKLLKNIKFNIQTDRDIVKFFFKHETREEYIDFTEKINSIKIKVFFHLLGWKLKKTGSGIINAENTKS